MTRRRLLAGPLSYWSVRAPSRTPGWWHGDRPGRDDEGITPYNFWVNAVLTPAPDHTALPAGLTVEEAVRIAEAITAAHPGSTRAVYDWAWSQWERWCHALGAAPLLAEPALVCAYRTTPPRLSAQKDTEGVPAPRALCR